MGEEHLFLWHLDSNPFDAEILPVLAMARYYFSFPQNLKDNTVLFEGTSQYRQYSHLFLDIIE